MTFLIVVGIVAALWILLGVMGVASGGVGAIFILGPFLPGVIVGSWISSAFEKLFGKEFFPLAMILGFLLYLPALGYGLKTLYDHSYPSKTPVNMKAPLTHEEEDTLRELLLKKKQAGN